MMLRRALPLTLLALAVAPDAHAAVADRFVPYYDAADGVRVGRDHTLRFAPKAKRIYNRRDAGSRSPARR